MLDFRVCGSRILSWNFHYNTESSFSKFIHGKIKLLLAERWVFTLNTAPIVQKSCLNYILYNKISSTRTQLNKNILLIIKKENIKKNLFYRYY